MNLFIAAGMSAEESGRSGRPSRASGRRVPLFNPKIVENAARLAAFNPTDAEKDIAKRYAETARHRDFASRAETAVRPRFYTDVLCGVLGYSQYQADRPYTLAFEFSSGTGKVDAALGRFGGGEKEAIVAPLEMKGPATADLDAIMPGRARSPVQQAWEYAIDMPGARWVLVSNCVEMRLYGFGRGRETYEVFDLRKIDEEREHERLWLILSAGRFLGGATEALLRETEDAYAVVSAELYRQYASLRERLIGFLVGAGDGPKLAPLTAIEVAQKLLDRILFVAFAERNHLLPDRLIERAASERNAFRPEPIWRNFLSLFRAVDQGEDGLAINAYNGGLFALDPLADSVVVPDALASDLAALGKWDYRSDVPVTILGHIFEQSVSDIEAMRAESRGLPAPAVTKRKRQGIVYTPDFVTRFLVERTLGVTLAERRDELLFVHSGSREPPSNGDRVGWRNGEESDRAFWRDYLSFLRSLTVVDPACGSGHFLVAAFDTLAEEYRRVVDRLANLGDDIDFDPMDEIVTRNLHGVDLSPESVEITRLSLWLKTARRQHRLQNLEATIKVGDSLIEDAGFTRHPFDWRAAFPDVFASGGFDIVIGNPPYVRMELIKPFKPYLAKNYVVAADRADLYAYFFERGVGLLKEGGRLGYISSSTFFRTGSGENLRTFLGDGVAIETVIDFGDLQLFEGVTTYPAILTLRKGRAGSDSTVSFIKVAADLPEDLGIAFAASARRMPLSRLGKGSWRFEDDALGRLRDKIAGGRKTLGEAYGPPLRGIVTGLNNAFVVETAIRDHLVSEDAKSAELLKPFLRGENIKRWRVEPEGLFLINTPRGKVNIDDYPAIRGWLSPFRPQLEKRATKQEWFELQQAQLAYQPRFSGPKIIFGHFARERIFAFEREGYFSNDKSYFIPDAPMDLLSLLNSKLVWSFVTSIAPAVSGGFHEMRVQYLEQVPVPQIGDSERARLAGLATSCSDMAVRRLGIESTVRHRLLDLATAGRRKLSGKLHDWWTLDFAAFRAEVQKVLRTEIPLKERDQWERYLAEKTAEVNGLTAAIADAEREIDAIVYRLFDLTPDEIRLLEDSLKDQYQAVSFETRQSVAARLL